MLFFEQLIRAEDSPHITVQHIKTFECSLLVVAGVGVLYDSSSQGEPLLMSQAI